MKELILYVTKNQLITPWYCKFHVLRRLGLTKIAYTTPYKTVLILIFYNPKVDIVTGVTTSPSLVALYRSYNYFEYNSWKYHFIIWFVFPITATHTFWNLCSTNSSKSSLWTLRWKIFRPIKSVSVMFNLWTSCCCSK